MKTIEQHSFKITIGAAITAIVAIVVFFVQANTRFERQESELKYLNEKTTRIELRQEAIALKQAQSELDVTKIYTKLEAIEVAILELKSDWKSSHK